MEIQSSFWIENPRILFIQKDMLPTNSMSMAEKYNAVTRLIIITMIIAFVITKTVNALTLGLISLCIIVIMYKFLRREGMKGMEDVKKKEEMKGVEGMKDVKKKEGMKEMQNKNNDIDMDALRSLYKPNKHNPLGNVLLTDIMDNPDRPAAQPAFNPDVADEITAMGKKQTQMLNPTIDNTSKQLYGDLLDNYYNDKCMQRFYSTANTRITDDGSGFAQYLYGGMMSGKEDTETGKIARLQDNYRYILY